ncbi:MAG TPA: hypothetical protein VMR52_10795 [Dehalococcoidia bacterium]|nr:hypothetical protein [Dehalococcoidia bacterium]
MTIARILALSLAALALLLAACGGDDDDDGDAPAGTAPAAVEVTADDDGDDPTNDNGDVISEACTLLTTDEISSALGGNVGEGAPGLPINPAASACQWTSTDSTVSLFIEVLSEGGRDWFENVQPGRETEPVEGIGDEATFDTIGVLEVIQGDVMVTVQPILPLSEVDDRQAAISLAELVLQRVN